MKTEPVLNLLKATKRVALWSTAMTGLAVMGLAQTTTAPPQSTPAPPGGYKIEETLLGRIDWGVGNVPALIAMISEDGRHVAYQTKSNCPNEEKGCYVVDGQSSPTAESDYRRYGEIDSRSADTSKPMYFNFHNAMSPDGKREAHVTRMGKHLTVEVDGHPGAEYDAIYGPAFSPDSKHVVFGARQGKTWSVVVDGQAGAAYDWLASWILPDRVNNSRDMSRPVYGVDGQSGVTYDDLYYNVVLPGGLSGGGFFEAADFTHLAFSSDGSHMAYVAATGGKDGKWVIVVDGRVAAEYKGGFIGYGSPALSPDGKRLAFSEGNGRYGPFRLVVDGQAGAEYASIFNPSFSPDGKHVAYGASMAIKERVGTGMTLVVDGQAGPVFSGIGNWAFSSDSKHVAYAARTQTGHNHGDIISMTEGGGKWSVILDGKAGNEYSIILPGSLLFDPDGTVRFFAIQKESHSDIFGSAHGTLYRVKYIPTP